MSGALPQHRTPSVPQFIGGQPVYKVPTGPDDWHAIRRTLRPTRPPVWRNGRLVAFDVFCDLRQRHVLTTAESATRPSKHARGRMRPRTPEERRRVRALTARLTQMRKTSTIDMNRLAAMEAAI